MLPAVIPFAFSLLAGDIPPILHVPDQGTCTVADLLPTSARASTRFGTSISVDGATLAVTGADIVWVYELIGQSFFIEQQIDSPLSCPGSFGQAIALDGDRLVIGAPTNGFAGSYSGTVLVYERMDGVWLQVQQLEPSDLVSTLPVGLGSSGSPWPRCAPRSRSRPGRGKPWSTCYGWGSALRRRSMPWTRHDPHFVERVNRD